MHMADALVSPAVGGTFLAVSIGLIAYSSKKIKEDIDSSIIPLMGVIGAFIFAAQMINFAIPMTGSSGHIGGGMLLAILLGPYAAFITIASIIIIQAFFFADGGLLAIGCNIFNIGFFPCFIAYPLIYRNITKTGLDNKRIIIASILSAVVGLQLGSFFVVAQTFFSGITELPFSAFVFVMQPIHFIIGIIEGIATAAIVLFIYKAQPELIIDNKNFNLSYKKFIAAFIAITIITAVGLTKYVSSLPDGLEWSIEKTAGVAELENPDNTVHSKLDDIQTKTSFLPEYNFKESENTDEIHKSSLFNEDIGTPISGIVGAIFVFILIISIGFIIKIVRRGGNLPPVRDRA